MKSHKLYQEIKGKLSIEPVLPIETPSCQAGAKTGAGEQPMRCKSALFGTPVYFYMYAYMYSFPPAGGGEGGFRPTRPAGREACFHPCRPES